MKRLAFSGALMALGVTGVSGCRDWDRFDPTAGGGVPVGGDNSGANNVGANNVGAGNQGGSGDGGDSPGGGPLGGGPPLDCGKIDILSDDFNEPLDWRWTADTWAVSVSGGDLVVPHPLTESYFQIETSAGFDFRGRAIVFELNVPPGPGAAVWLNVAGDTSNYLEFHVDTNGTLNFNYEKVDDLLPVSDSQPFDPALHRFMRFREQAGVCFYGLSPDGQRWNEVTSWQLDDIWDPAFTSVYIGGYTDGVTAPDGDMHIARVYAEQPIASDPCAIDSLTDDFNDDERASAWYGGWNSSMCPIGETGGELKITCQPGADESSGYVSSSAYDLRGTSVTIEVVDYPASGSSGYMALGVRRPEADTFFQFEINDGNLHVIRALDDNWTTLLSADYDPVAARFLRIREALGTVYFEVSPDGATFTTFHNEGATFDVSQLLIFAMGGSYLASAPVDMAFDNLNVGP